MARYCWRRIAVLVSVFAFACPISNAQYVYWADTFAYTINRAKIDGTEQQTILYLGFEGVQDLALDLEQGKIYWTNPKHQVIERCNLQGSARETVVSSPSTPLGIALDLPAGKIYWTTQSPSGLMCSDLNGENIETIISTGPGLILDVALDIGAGFIYLTSMSTVLGGVIYRTRPDGSNLMFIAVGLQSPTKIALDSESGKIFWGERGTHVIKRANLDGSGVEIVVPSGNVSPLGLSVDPWGRKLYWVDSVTDDFFVPDARIHRSNLDGSSIETLIPTGLFEPRTLALFTECIDAEDGALCHDGNPCTDDDYCVDQHCLGTFNFDSCDDANPCTVEDQCTAGFCIGTPAALPCDDRAECTANDTCTGYSCAGERVSDECFHFFLMVTKVNGVPCASCPTSDVPIGEVLPGDIITVEAYLENWEDDPDTGVCDNNAPCSVSAQDCTGKHCFLANGASCQTDEFCGPDGPCVPDQCDPAPGVAAYQWTLDFAGLTAGIDGVLNPLELPCLTDADCRHELVACTCEDAVCINGTCNMRGAIFVNSAHPDFIFQGSNSFSIFWGDNAINPFPGLGAGTIDRGIADPGRATYLGTLLLQMSENARGTFRVDVDRGKDFTFVLDQDVVLLEGLSITPVVVNLCDVVDNANDCNANEYPDECEPDGDDDGLIDACDPCPIDALNDSDGDGICDGQDGCPSDAMKAAPGICGCGLADSGDADADGVLDCVDVCPGVNDSSFGTNCTNAIPAASTWGLVVLALLLMVGAKLSFARRVTISPSKLRAEEGWW